MHKQSYKAYAAATQTVAKTKQVVMLYDAAIKSSKLALEAIQAGDIQTRFNELEKASNIVFGLQGSLDFESGGDVAKTLYDYYASVDARLISVHRSNDAQTVESVIRDLTAMRDTWIEIDKLDEEGQLHGSAEPLAPPPMTNTPGSDGGVVISA